MVIGRSEQKTWEGRERQHTREQQRERTDCRLCRCCLLAGVLCETRKTAELQAGQPEIWKSCAGQRKASKQAGE